MSFSLGGQGRQAGRSDLVSNMIGAGFGIGWLFWGATALPGGVVLVVRVTAIAVATVVLMLFVRAVRVVPPVAEVADGGAPQAVGSRRFGGRYRLIVAAEVLAIVAGITALHRLEIRGGEAAWIAVVVGVHFLGLGKIWRAPALWVLGTVVTMVGLIVIGLTLAGIGGPEARTAWATLPTGLLLISFSTRSLSAASRPWTTKSRCPRPRS